MAKRGKKFTKMERETVLARVSKLACMGYNNVEIAKDIGVSPNQVGIYVNEVRERYKQFTFKKREEYVAEKLEQLAIVRSLALTEYERSKEDTKKQVIEHTPIPSESNDEGHTNGTNGKKNGGKGKGKVLHSYNFKKDGLVVSKVTNTTEGRLGANEFLRTVMETVRQERELLGLDEPKAPDQNTFNVIQVNWDKLYEAPDSNDKPDEIEQKIEEAKQLGVNNEIKEVVNGQIKQKEGERNELE